MSTSPTPIPAYLVDLVDDAAIFPPGNADLPTAVSAHREHQQAAHADLVGPFVVSDVRIPELITALDAAQSATPLATSIVVTGGAGAIAGAVRWANGARRIELRSLEFALRDEADLVHNARRVTAALDELLSAGELDEDVAVYIEPPRLFGAAPTHSWLGALDEVAAAGYRLKLRTGGLDADAFPGSAEVATWVETALDRELAFKCTAGLHHAVRHRDEDTGFVQHGFLNVLLTTRASLDGATPAELHDILEESDLDAVTARLDAAGSTALVSARRWFTSFGSCSVTEPVHDLTALGLLDRDWEHA